MTEPNFKNLKTQLHKGILEYCVLLIIRDKACYVQDILKRLGDANISAPEPSIYTLMNRLKRENKVTYEWEESPMGPPRKYYSITDLGRKTLEYLEKAWSEMNLSINRL